MQEMMIVAMAFLLAVMNWIAMTFITTQEVRGWLAFILGLVFVAGVIAVVYYPGSCSPLQIQMTTALTNTTPK
jgi:uncharacterized membrane protein YGL010W